MASCVLKPLSAKRRRWRSGMPPRFLARPTSCGCSGSKSSTLFERWQKQVEVGYARPARTGAVVMPATSPAAAASVYSAFTPAVGNAT
jgi:hypothetical protein